MSEFANTTIFPFEGLSNAVAVDTVADIYETPQDFREVLGDLARLAYVKGRCRYRIELSAASTAGAANIKIMAGSTEVASEAVDLTTGATITGSFYVDLTPVLGGSKLSVVLSTTTAADASVTAQVMGQLICEHPLVISA